jgi:hypothetical protein
MKIWQKFWIAHNGPIPKDKFGKSFHIHHIDGDRNNNHIGNLMCLSESDHHKIHHAIGDIYSPPREKKEHSKRSPAPKCPHCGYVINKASRIGELYHGDNCLHAPKK